MKNREQVFFFTMVSNAETSQTAGIVIIIWYPLWHGGEDCLFNETNAEGILFPYNKFHGLSEKDLDK